MNGSFPCAINAEIIPASTSPVPPCVIPALPAVLVIVFVLLMIIVFGCPFFTSMLLSRCFCASFSLLFFRSSFSSPACGSSTAFFTSWMRMARSAAASITSLPDSFLIVCWMNSFAPGVNAMPFPISTTSALSASLSTSFTFFGVKFAHLIFFVMMSGAMQLIVQATFSGAATVTRSAPLFSVASAAMPTSAGAPM